MSSTLSPNPVELRFTLPAENMPARPDLVIADRLGPIAMQDFGVLGLEVFCAHPGPEVDWGTFAPLDHTIWTGYGLSVVNKTELRDRGVDTPRGALVVGSDFIAGLEGFGPRIVERLASAIQRKFPVLRLLRAPTPAYATVFCRDLSEVPLAAVYHRTVQRGPRISLQDVLDRTDKIMSRGIPDDALERIFDETAKYAQEFNQEKANSRRA